MAALLATALLSGYDLLPPLAPAALLPLVAKAIHAAVAQPTGPIPTRRIGFVELGHTVAFLILAAAAFHAPL